MARFVDIQTIDRSLQAAYRSASERTTYSLEKSPLIEKLVMEEYGGGYEDLLGELQLSFIMFLLLFSYPALEHWKCMVSNFALLSFFLSNIVPLIPSVSLIRLFTKRPIGSHNISV